jgi:hypothetical protein
MSDGGNNHLQTITSHLGQAPLVNLNNNSDLHFSHQLSTNRFSLDGLSENKLSMMQGPRKVSYFGILLIIKIMRLLFIFQKFNYDNSLNPSYLGSIAKQQTRACNHRVSS